MSKRTGICMVAWLLIAACPGIVRADASAASRLEFDNVQASASAQFDTVRPLVNSFIAVKFTLADGWHFYADAATAAGGMDLKVEAKADGVTFGSAVFPASHMYFDPSAQIRLRVYSGDFTVYIPFTVQTQPPATGPIPIEVSLQGAVCTKELCAIREGTMTVEVAVSPDAPMDRPAFKVTGPAPAGTSIFVAIPLAILAGLTLNIMPCVWPVLPIVVMRLLDQAGKGRGRSVVFGVAFSAGILLFFLAFAAVNIVLRVGFGAAFSFADLSQNAGYLILMAMLLVVLAMFMFGVLNVGIPSSLTGKGGGSGIAGSVGTGFLAAILATPCSFGILVAVLVWAQTQPIPLATLAILLIGVGMALPYLALTMIPGMVGRLPRPGRWMDIFKQAVGFVMLLIAVKLVAGLPSERLASVLYYGVILAFAVWMWGGWVDYSSPARRKWLVRIMAVIVAVVPGYYLLHQPSPQEQLIKWQPYDAAKIEEAVSAGRPVLVDFTAAWCFNCTVLDKVVYTRRDIADLVVDRNVLAIKADVTLAEYPASAALKGLGESAIPLNVLYVPGQAQPRKFRGIFIGADLKSALESLRQPVIEQPVMEQTSEQETDPNR